MLRNQRLFLVLAVLGWGLIACGGAPGREAVTAGEETIDLSSPEFTDGDPIPDRFTCDGEDISPPLRIRNVPEGTESLVLTVVDPDAPGGTFVHWLIWNLPADTGVIEQGVPPTDTVETLHGAHQGTNGFDEVGYRGPCPPPGPAHRYRFSIYALDRMLELEPGARRETLESAMGDHVLEEGVLVGAYAR